MTLLKLNTKKLQEIIESTLGTQNIFKFNVDAFFQNNLNPKFIIRDYQKKAFQYFMSYIENKESFDLNTRQFMFNMATGSGKTFVMAGLILYLYQKGYRKFVFFVDSDSIIQKTKENFLNSTSSKYLFKHKELFINNKLVKIKEVENFEYTNQNDIHIMFSTIQGLHMNFENPKENSLTYDDLDLHEVVLIADEAHHFNADTKQNQKKLNLNDPKPSWENTVLSMFNANQNNILLEFTATIDLNSESIFDKYIDKIVYQYDLRSFNNDKYSKRIKILQADLAPMDRALYAVILSQYRRKVFAEFKINAKPVILMKSKTIDENKDNLKLFSEMINNLTAEKLTTIKDSTQEQLIKDILSKQNLDNFLLEIQDEFSSDKLIQIDSKSDSENKQNLINSLEDDSNPFRVIFAVDKLNEGWDVLNLFDIVQLYETASSKKVNKKSTESEAQLIGRGARYFPFEIILESNKDDLERRFKRKFDNLLNHELSICEDLYYHSFYNPPYINELNRELEHIGLKSKKIKEIEISLKTEFTKSNFYLDGHIYLNKKIKRPVENSNSISDAIKNITYEAQLKTGISSISESLYGINSKEILAGTASKLYRIKDFRYPIILKALNKIDDLSFDKLKKIFPNLKSKNEFIESENYLANVKINISGDEFKVKDLTLIDASEQLEILINCLSMIASKINSKKYDYIGSKEFYPRKLKDIIKPLIKMYLDENNPRKSILESFEPDEYVNICEKESFVYNDLIGTDQERKFVHYFYKNCDKFINDYKDIYLIRNENCFKLFDFKTGQGFMPDFVLFLKSKQESKNVIYQIFIEPKGGYLISKDEWKQDFLLQLSKEGILKPLNTIHTKDQYIIWGLPFFTNEDDHKQQLTYFNSEFSDILNLQMD